MNSPLMTQIGQRVVAWHNRHPLARRITLAHIHSIGVVALPFDHVDPANLAVDPAAAADTAEPAPPAGRFAALKAPLRSLLSRLRLPRRRKVPPISADGRQAVFDEDFIGSLPEGEARRWAEQHALRSRPGEDDWPQRDVPVARRWAREAAQDDASAPPLSTARRAELNDLIVDLSDRPPEANNHAPSPADAPADDEATGPQIRWAVTAAIDVDGARRRLLLTNTAKPAILGRRAISPARLIAATALLSLLLAAGMALPWLKPVKAAQAAGHASAAASAASGAASKPLGAASGASAAAPSSAVGHGHEPAATDAHDAHAAADTASDAASSPTAESAHADGQGEGQGGAHAGTVAGAANAKAGPASAPSTAGSSATAPSTAASVAAPTPAGPVFALVSRAAMSQAEPQVALQRMQASAAELASTMPDTHTELVQQRGRWQAVWWPFRSRADATQARWALALKGVTVEVVEF